MGRAKWFATLLVAMSVGCHAHCLDPDNVGPAMEKVIERHDAYVETDPTLEPIVREARLTTSQLLRETLEQAKRGKK